MILDARVIDDVMNKRPEASRKVLKSLTNPTEQTWKQSNFQTT